jgi:hypothetical protein
MEDFGGGFWDMMMWCRPRYEEKDAIRIELKFDSIDDFYAACHDPDKNAWNQSEYIEHLSYTNSSFVGLRHEELEKYKYSYQPGIAKLEQLKEDLLLDGASCFKNKWDDIDGEEMSMERLYDEMPFMNKRIRKHGFLNGKFVKLYISINENCNIDQTAMLNKTYTAVSIVDYLESTGYRVEVYAITDIDDIGQYNGKHVKQCYSELPIKKWDETLNIGLLLTLLSPWAFRHWHFLLYTGNMYTYEGIGRSAFKGYTSKPGELYIQNGECLDEEDSKRFINEIKTMYDETVEENVY